MGASTLSATKGLRFSDPNDVAPIGPGLPPPLPVAQFKFDLAEKAFDTLGLDRAAQHLRRFRSGAGGDLFLSREDASRIPLIRMAEDRTRNHFETRTFVGQGKEAIAKRLRNLPDGGTDTIEDEFVGGINFVRPARMGPLEYIGKLGRDALAIANDVPGYLALGKTSVTSKGTWDVMRRGNQFIFRGKVDHSLKDPFNFDEGQPGHRKRGHSRARAEARSFTIRHDFTAPSSALAELRPDGSLRLISARWGEDGQHHSRSLAKPLRSLLGR
ncbi:MAG: hypothetical protein ACREJ5_22500 [Geminicoccaceae bacterium]